MKKLTATTFYLVMVLAALFTACKKPHDDIIIPEPTKTFNTYQFSLDSLPDETNTGITNIYAVINVVNDKNEVVVSDKKLSLQYNGKYTTEKLELPKGTYQLTRFLIVNNDNIAKYATPITNSVKALLVQKPLAIAFTLPQTTSLIVPLAVVPIQNGDKEESFGYPTGAFNNSNNGNNDNNNGSTDTNPFFKIKVKAVVKIGDVIYDSIPAGLMITTWDSHQNRTINSVALKPGVNEISLAKSAIKYDLRMGRYDVVDEMTLLKSEVKENQVYIMGGSRTPKKLKSELTYIEINGQYVTDSRINYIYDGSGNLFRIDYLKDKHNQQRWERMMDRFEYNNGRVERINHYNEKDSLFGFTSFTYDGQGRVAKMFEKKYDQETKADVEYYENTVTKSTAIKISYQYNTTTNSMRYYMNLVGGNLVSGNSNTDNHNAELGRYNYDTNINPYVFLNWPDLYLSHSSKNNIIWQVKEYSGAYPTANPYYFGYTYDAEGYPKELIRNYENVFTHAFLYKTKTVYTY